MPYIYPNTLNTFVGDRPYAARLGFIEIDDETYQDLLKTKKKWDDGKIIDDPDYDNRIQTISIKEDRKKLIRESYSEIEELKNFLYETDYVVIKLAEGVTTFEEYSEILEKRKVWRARINELRNIIKEAENISDNATN